MPRPMLRLATRGSPQALAQSIAVARSIERSTGRSVELITVQTTGDARQDVPLHVIGGQGVFVKEVQRAVLEGRADLAAHSCKDLPSLTENGLHLAAFCARRDPRDALVGQRLAELGEGATVATGSVRRRAQLARARPDLAFAELRGNIGTRLDRIPDGGAVVVAVAALEILELTDRIAERLPIDVFVPAVGQGCVAVECRVGDERARDALATIDDAATRSAVEVERSFLAELGAGCSMPVGAHVSDGELHAFLADLDAGTTVDDVVHLDPAGDTAAHASNCERAREAARALRAALGVNPSDPLQGRRVVVTREHPGPLGDLLAARGVEVVHVPLIAVVDPEDGGAALRAALDRLDDFDWLVVTSPTGAARVGAAARRFPGVRVAVVGTSTAAALASVGRAVDLVPSEQHGAALAESLARLPPARMLLALADRAPTTLAESLAEAGHTVTSVVAYRTASLAAGPGAAADAQRVAAADALLLASGSAAQSWVERFGRACPPVVVAIGPSTASVARRSGLKVTAVATDHSLTGLVDELERCFAGSAEDSASR